MNKQEDWTRVLLYGTFDGFGWSTDGDDNILLVLDNGDKVEIPNHFVKNASDFVEKNQIKLKDVIARIKQLDIGTRKVWLDEFLNELGSDYGTLKYKDGYEQGKVEGPLEREKVTIPQFVAGWLNYCKRTGVDLYHAFEMGGLYLGNYAYQKDYSKLKGYFETENNQDLFARAWLDGYEIEKEKQYRVKVKGHIHENILVYGYGVKRYFFSSSLEGNRRAKHTRKELEDAGFGWVFDCLGIEIEEVE